jgi:protoheme IX farnesyltransferase
MSSQSIITEQLAPSTAQAGGLARSAALSDYWALTKPEINFLILITTAAGFYLGALNEALPVSFNAWFSTLLGTLLVASGTATLNQYIERHFDAQMRRTARRPVAAGRLNPREALVFGIALSATGCIYLAVSVNPLTSLLALLTLLSYLFLYTPLKRKTALCVLVGAFPGAMPPLIGWAGATGSVHLAAWVCYAILFLWQLPHFMAIAWMYREDYDRAGYMMLPKGNLRVHSIMLQTLLPLIALIPISVMSLSIQPAVPIYWVGLLPGLAFLYFGLDFVKTWSRLAARRLLFASIIYLPLWFLFSALCTAVKR